MIIDSHIHLHLDSATDDPDIGGKIIRDAMRCGIGACIASHVIAEPSAAVARIPPHGICARRIPMPRNRRGAIRGGFTFWFT